MLSASLAYRTGIAIAALALAALPALAQPGQWPDRPVKMIVPLGAGGPADLVGRYVAQQLGEKFKQSFFIENRPGAAGIIGTAEAAKAPPDGYTLLVVASPHINLEILSTNKTYQLMRDFTAVSVAFSTDAVLVVHPSVPANNVKELIALAKAKPGALTYASSGPGSNKHLGGELFKLMTGTDILHVAYKGSTGARNDIIGGHVNMMFDEVPSLGTQCGGGTASRARRHRGETLQRLPDVPTVSEAGVPGLRAHRLVRHYGAGRDAQADRRSAQREMRALVARPDVKATWDKLGTETMSMTPAESEAFLRAELDKWTKVVKAANIKLE
jgi:tripartite-type tricarboxylate transporter receptor subunit TctC